MNDEVTALSASVPDNEIRQVDRLSEQARSEKFMLSDLSIQWLLYPILAVYVLPVLAIAGAGIATDGFRVDHASLSFARVMANDFYDSLRQTIGVIFLPLLTAYAVKVDSAHSRIPVATAILFFLLLGLFITTVAVYGLVEIKQSSLIRYTTEIDGKTVSLRDFFKTSASTYAKELLAYLAIVLGITLKK